MRTTAKAGADTTHLPHQCRYSTLCSATLLLVIINCLHCTAGSVTLLPHSCGSSIAASPLQCLGFWPAVQTEGQQGLQQATCMDSTSEDTPKGRVGIDFLLDAILAAAAAAAAATCTASSVIGGVLLKRWNGTNAAVVSCDGILAVCQQHNGHSCQDLGLQHLRWPQRCAEYTVVLP